MNKYFEAVIHDMDNDITLKKAYQWLYYITGALCLVSPISMLYSLLNKGRDLTELIKNIPWQATLAIIFLLVWLVATSAVCFLIFKYWKKHGDELKTTIPNGSPYTNTIFVSDYLKCFSYSSTLLYYVPIVVFVVLAFIWCALTNFADFYKDYHFFIGLGIVLLVIVLCALLAIGQVLLFRFLSEHIIMKVNMANDLRDLGDIYRNAAIVNNDSVEEKVEESSTNLE